MTDGNFDENERSDDLYDAAAKRPFNPDSGEDESSTSKDGRDDHLHNDQKPITGLEAGSNAPEVDDGDPHKAEKLTKAGRDIDPDEGAD